MPEGRQLGLHEAKYEMKRTVRGLKKRLDKKIPLFPEGEYVLMTRCKIMDHRTGTLSSHFSLVGSGPLMDAAERQRQYFIDHCPTDDDDEDESESTLEENDTTLADTYLIMPTSAIPRATKLREMMRLLWKLEGHSDTKQIYKAVAKGEPGFSWWTTEFPDIPFTNKAVESAGNSVRIYRGMAPKLYERIVGQPPTVEAPEEPFVRCDRQHHVTGLQQCSLRKNHRGVCNMTYVVPVVREEVPMEEEERQNTDPAEFYSMLRRIGHKKEPFLKFTAGEIKILGVHLKSGMHRLAAYRHMGLTIDRSYEKWFKNKNGAVVWEEIRRKFPDYLDDYVLDPRETLQEEVPKEKKTETRVKKSKTTKRKTVNIANRLKSTRQKNAFKRKQKSLETAGYV